MVSFWFLGVLILILWIVVKARHMKHRATFIILLALLVFFYTSGYKVIKDGGVNLNSLGGILQAGKLYFSWLYNSFGNIKTIAGNAVKLNWDVNNTISNTISNMTGK